MICSENVHTSRLWILDSSNTDNQIPTLTISTTLMCREWNLFVASSDVKSRVGAVYLVKITHNRYRWGTVIYYMHSSAVNLFA